MESDKSVGVHDLTNWPKPNMAKESNNLNTINSPFGQGRRSTIGTIALPPADYLSHSLSHLVNLVIEMEFHLDESFITSNRARDEDQDTIIIDEIDQAAVFVWFTFEVFQFTIYQLTFPLIVNCSMSACLFESLFRATIPWRCQWSPATSQ